jgi:thymidylate synthase (FAD)
MTSSNLNRIEVLNRGYVDYVDHLGNDLTVVNAARVSFQKESHWEAEEHQTGSVTSKCLSEKDQKLIKYLAKHNHWTPFAHPQITLRIKAPISIRTQFFKHKQGFVENEVSRRYVTDPPEFYIPLWRKAPTEGAKQGSSGFIESPEEINTRTEKYVNALENCIKHYESLIDSGIAPEQARFVLPQGVFTEWWWTGSLAAYSRFYKQRSDSHAQWEIQQYAEAVSKIIQKLFPESWSCLIEST